MKILKDKKSIIAIIIIIIILIVFIRNIILLIKEPTNIFIIEEGKLELNEEAIRNYYSR